MNRVLVVRSSNRPIPLECAASVHALEAAGAGVVDQTGSAEVSLARNLALSRALDVLRKPEARPFDLVLMVDDDMVFAMRAAELVVAHARATGLPASACYALANGSIPFERLPGGRFMGGLGFVAVPVAVLASLATRSSVVTTDSGEAFWEFTSSASEAREDGTRRWLPEDYRLTRELGGVDLLPIAIGHLKAKVVMPDRATFEALTGVPS